MNPNPTTYDVPTGLSNLLGAYDEGHWQTQVCEIKGGIGVLERGSVLATGRLPAAPSTLQSSGSSLLDRALGRDQWVVRNGKFYHFERPFMRLPRATSIAFADVCAIAQRCS